MSHGGFLTLVFFRLWNLFHTLTTRGLCFTWRQNDPRTGTDETRVFNSSTRIATRNVAQSMDPLSSRGVRECNKQPTQLRAIKLLQL